MIEIIKDPFFAAIPSIQHGFFTRTGGVSLGEYASLNCAYTSADPFENIQENRRRMMQALDKKPQLLVTIDQIHSNKVLIIDQYEQVNQNLTADGLVTKLSSRVLGIQTADCAAILFVDPLSEVIGIAHAGWRGALTGIIPNTIAAMEQLGAQTKHIKASIGPCIHQHSYEVDSNFYLSFLMKDQHNHIFFKPSAHPQHFMFDLQGFIKKELFQHSITAVSTTVAFNTYTDKRFFSCRRAKSLGEKDFGRQLSYLFLN